MPDAQPPVTADDGYWLPDFCTVPALTALMVLAELVALVILFAPQEHTQALGSRIVVSSLFVQWLTLCCALVLCRLRSALIGLSIGAGVVLAYTSVLAIIAGGSTLVYWLDHALGMSLTIEPNRGTHFVLANVSITALVTAAAFRYFYVRAQWQREIRAQAKSQVDALQARIRPHFLFNSMNTIASLIRTRPADAETAVEDLSELFRAALGAGVALRTLGDELDLIAHYLAIEKLRLGERLQVDQQTDTLPRDLPVPALLLQPLVENAVLHGIQRLPEGGTVTLRAEVHPQHVRIVIRNPRVAGASRLAQSNGTALDNIRQRIRYHFGDRGALDVDAGADYYAVSVTIPRP